MNETLFIKSIFIFIVFWGLGILLLWFRPKVEIFWKIIATIIFAFYIFFFFDEINSGYNNFISGWYDFTLNFLIELITLIFGNLFFLWPLVLILIFYKADPIGSEKLLKFMCVLTIILWIIFIIYFFYSKGIDGFLFENLKKMIPDVK